MTEQPDTAAIRADEARMGEGAADPVVLVLCDALDAARAKYDEIGDEVRELDVQIWIGKYRDEQARAEVAEARIAELEQEVAHRGVLLDAAEARITKALEEFEVHGGDTTAQVMYRALTGEPPA